MILEKAGTSTKTSTSLAIKSMTQVSRPSESDFRTTSGVQSHRVQPLPFECVYRGEGNANLVIALPYEHHVIRLRKSDPSECSPDGGLSRVNREKDFIKIVLSPFLQPYLNVPEILRYDETELAEFSKMIHVLRPEHRRSKQAVEEYATKFPDYAFLPEFLKNNGIVSGRSKSTFCVEIKPKQGFLCKADQKFQKCPYCLTQYYKLKNKAISIRSRYCALDLFSGECNRMRRALKSLLQDPQNNLKIFKDGVVVYDQDSHTNDLDRIFGEWFTDVGDAPDSREKHFDLFFSLVREALLREFPNENQDSRESDQSLMAFQISPDIEVPSRLSSEIVAKAKKMLYFTNEECDFTSNDLPEGSVLKRILEMQGLHRCGADVISWIYSKYSSILDNEIIYSNLIDVYESRENIRRLTPLAKCMNSLISDQYNFTKEDINEEELQKLIEDPVLLLNRQNSKERDKEKVLGNGTAKEKSIVQKFPIEEEIVALRNYLLFCTAKDCSILIAFQEFDPSESRNISDEYVIQISKHLKFLASVRISDLDPKSVHSIEKHRRRDLKTLNAVIDVIEEELALGNQTRPENSLEKY